MAVARLEGQRGAHRAHMTLVGILPGGVLGQSACGAPRCGKVAAARQEPAAVPLARMGSSAITKIARRALHRGRKLPSGRRSPASESPGADKGLAQRASERQRPAARAFQRHRQHDADQRHRCQSESSSWASGAALSSRSRSWSSGVTFDGSASGLLGGIGRVLIGGSLAGIDAEPPRQYRRRRPARHRWWRCPGGFSRCRPDRAG